MRLNETKPREKYEVFEGRNTEQMLKLVADSRTPLSVAGLMTRRLEVRNSHDTELKANWNNHYFDTGDGALYLPDGKVVVAYDAQVLKEMTGDSKLIGGALDLTGQNLEGIEGETFTKAQLERMVLGQGLTLDQAKNHPLWLAFARGDKKLSDAYTEMIFTDNKERFGYDTNMGVWKSPTPETPQMRAWCVDWSYYRSDAGGSGNLDGDNGRLVGLASETQGSEKQ